MLQHPLEVDNPKGSARLLHLSLPNSRMLTGELFDAQEGLAPPGLQAGSARHAILLYPDMPSAGATRRRYR